MKDPSKKVETHIRSQATKYVLLDDELYYRTLDGVLLRCLSDDESKSLMVKFMGEYVGTSVGF